MRNRIQISNVRFMASTPDGIRSGLIGWVSCDLNGKIRLDGLALRRTQSGRLALSFPARKDRGGRNRFYVRPLDDATRREIERQVFQALQIQEESA